MLNIKEAINKAFKNDESSIKIHGNIKEESKGFIDDFLNYTRDFLKLDDLPEIIFTDDRLIAPMTTGVFIPKMDKIFIYTKNRLTADWLKTLAHELTHYKQYVEERIPENLEGRNQKLEAEANVAAGDILYNFAHLSDENNKIYDI